MMLPKYVKGEIVDENYKGLMKAINQHIKAKNDDYRLLTVGETGSGKSLLALIGLELYGGDRVTVADNVAFNYPDFTRVQYNEYKRYLEGLVTNPVVMMDEFNMLSRSSMTKENRSMIKNYLEVRGANLLHLWCTPSLKNIDKAVLHELMNGVILITNKNQAPRPRGYYFWSRADFEKYVHKCGGWSKLTADHLTSANLKKKAKKFVTFAGLFYEYNGRLRPEYERFKSKKILQTMEEQMNKFAPEEFKYNMSKLSIKFNVHRETIRNWFAKYKQDGRFEEGKHYVLTPKGNPKFSEAAINEFLGRNGANE